MSDPSLWPLYALLAALLTSFLPIVNKRLLAEADVPLVAWGSNALSLPILAVAAFLLTPPVQTDLIFGLGVVVSGILNMIAALLSTAALQAGEASLVTPFLTFNPVFTLFISIFALHEIPGMAG